MGSKEISSATSWKYYEGVDGEDDMSAFEE